MHTHSGKYETILPHDGDLSVTGTSFAVHHSHNLDFNLNADICLEWSSPWTVRYRLQSQTSFPNPRIQD